MNNTLPNVSGRIERYNVLILSAVDAVAHAMDMSFFVAGALVRDVLMGYLHDIHPERLTRDTDIAIAVSDWQAFDAFRKRLLEHDGFESTRVLHRLKFAGVPVDFMPFDGVENANREIRWPDDEGIVMNMQGYAEANERTVAVQVSQDLVVRFAALPEYACLKLIAWNDRCFREGTVKDAQDFAFLLQNYLAVGNEERFFNEHADMLDADDFDYEIAGARLLARDILARSSNALVYTVQQILTRGMTEGDRRRLPESMTVGKPDNLQRYERLVVKFQSELAGDEEENQTHPRF